MLPTKYLVVFIAVLVAFLALCWYLQYGRRIGKPLKVMGKIFIICLCIMYGIGLKYLIKGDSTINSITDANIKTHMISVVVMKDSKIKSLRDTADQTYGIVDAMDNKNTYKTIEKVNKAIKKEVDTQSYASYVEASQALIDGYAKVILLNESYRSMVEESISDFSEKTIVLKQFKEEEKLKDISKDVDVTSESFNFFISGIDTYGDISAVSRSDVNLLLTINPNTHQILMTHIPRDYFIPFTCLDGRKDKLTDSGIYGVDCTVASLENYLNININYYGRVNFNSLINLVDILGGITVDSSYSFSAGGYTFPAGTQLLNGKQALAFSRERKTLNGGDRERGRNQMRVLTAIIDKVLSKSIIIKYDAIMESFSNSFQTNLAASEMSSLIKMQLNDMSSWTIIQQSVNGSDSTDYSYTIGHDEYVMIPYESSVKQAKRQINQVLNNE